MTAQNKSIKGKVALRRPRLLEAKGHSPENVQAVIKHLIIECTSKVP